VVLGQESTGKSSILERLAMMSLFPRAETICTRVPIHVRMRNTATATATTPTTEAFNERTRTTEDGPGVNGGDRDN
jgi:GTPase SAR1 family protein